MNVPETIILGVVTGILTSIVVFVSTQVVSKIIIPWYQEVVYKGIDLRGLYNLDISDDERDINFSLELQQNSYNLTGNLSFSRNKNGEKTFRNYSVTGDIWEGYVNLLFNPTDRRNLSVGNGLFKVSANGEKLSGYFTFRDNKNNHVTSSPLDLRRQIL